jgi:hypothetical protein
MAEQIAAATPLGSVVSAGEVNWDGADTGSLRPPPHSSAISLRE